MRAAAKRLNMRAFLGMFRRRRRRRSRPSESLTEMRSAAVLLRSSPSLTPDEETISVSAVEFISEVELTAFAFH